MMTRNDAEIDLRWYYQEAGGVFGLRSVLGPQLDALRTDSAAHGPQRFSDDMIQLLGEHMGEIERLCAVSRRLIRITLGQRHSLDLAYSSPRMIAGVPVALAAAQPTAIASHRAVLKELAGEKTRMTRHTRSVMSRQHRAKRLSPGMTVSGWLEALHMVARQAGGEHCGEVLAQVVLEATAVLNAALLAYCEVSMTERDDLDLLVSVDPMWAGRNAIKLVDDPKTTERIDAERFKLRRADVHVTFHVTGTVIAKAEQDRRQQYDDHTRGKSISDYSAFDPELPWVEGQCLTHKQFGKGVVLGVDGRRVRVLFEDAAIRGLWTNDAMD